MMMMMMVMMMMMMMMMMKRHGAWHKTAGAQNSPDQDCKLFFHSKFYRVDRFGRLGRRRVGECFDGQPLSGHGSTSHSTMR